jgi:hypothetical protein
MVARRAHFLSCGAVLCIYESGSIPQQISKEISGSRFGLCYFSELLEADGHPKHQDSLNVTFEAGMLHARTATTTNDTSHQPSGWIPIREKDSGPPPFDFAAERILYVPRDEKGDLCDKAFEDMLRKRIQKLLGIEPGH